MTIIDTSGLKPNSPLPALDNHQVYCGLDSCLTVEILETLLAQYPNPPQTYDFERALQGPYLEIMQRGILVNESARRAAAGHIHERRAAMQEILDEFAQAVWGKGLNPNSPKQLKEFFYQKLHLPEVWLSQKGERKLSTNREALEKLDNYLHARPFIQCILRLRDLKMDLNVLESELDSDGRFRSSYNIAGTETGRPSSSTNAFGTGGNAQNITPDLRFPFVADPGYKMAVIDLEQVEARDVGFIIGCLFDDWTFLNNCESGDLHSNNAKLIWPHLPWTGDRKRDREIADGQFYREFSFRDMAKRGGHLCLTPDHEVLTPYGWVPITEKPVQIMQWDEKTGSEFAYVSHWTDEAYSGNLQSFEGNSISALMTDNHRVPYRADSRSGKIKTKLASDGPGLLMPLGAGYCGGNKEVPARLIAAFMSDGNQKSVNRMDFHLTKQRKISRLFALCEQYGFVIESMSNDKYSVHGNLPKRAGAYMFEWTKECLLDFLDEYKYWDGYIGPTSVSLFSVDKEHLDWIKTFGRILGIGGNINHSKTTSGFGGDKTYVTDYYVLQQNNRQYANGHSIKWTKQPVLAVRVLCPTVPSSFFYVRRNGKIFVTGNSNYSGTAWTMARSLKIPQSVADEFQARYCRGGPGIAPAFPGIPRYWQWVAEQLQTKGYLTTLFGRKRHFFGRPDDPATIREAIASVPQGTTAERMNLGLWRVWHQMPEVQLLGQTYDSITFQYPEDLDESLVIARALELIRIPLYAPNGREFIVPGEAKVGWNWGSRVTPDDAAKAVAKGLKAPRINPDGLVKFKPGVPDQRVRTPIMQRMIET